jgi:histidinol-phosphate aminotransferase
MTAGAFVEPGTYAVTARHTFSQYTFATTIFGGRMKYADMPDGRFDLPAIAELVDDDTRVVFICNPNNPTAAAVSHDEFASFLEVVPEDVVIVVDEAYGEFADSSRFPRTLDLLRTHANLMRVRTFSKIYGLAGLRVGYATGQPDLITTVSKVRQPFNVGTLAQEAAIAALDDASFVEESVRNNEEGRARICAALDGLGIAYFPSQANFVCAHFPAGRAGGTAADVLEGLAARRIAVRPLHSFGLPNHLRISVGTPDEVAALCDALREIARDVPPAAT